MAAYKTGTFVRSKYYTLFYKTPLKWIPRSKYGASKSRPRWAAHTRRGNVWEYPPPPGTYWQFKQSRFLIRFLIPVKEIIVDYEKNK